ncbi:hypothetical protein IGJ34_001655 [Enterococcus sp. AZ177]
MLVRKKIYKKEHILAAAQDLLLEKGFSFITARNVAKHMEISTQPIYLEFKNMEELKLTLLKTIHVFLENEFFSKIKTSNNCANFALNYIDLAKTNKKLYISLFVEPHSYGKELQKLFFSSFQKYLLNDDNYRTVSNEQLETLHKNIWIVAAGIASLSGSGIVNQTEGQLIALFTTIEKNSGIS